MAGNKKANAEQAGAGASDVDDLAAKMKDMKTEDANATTEGQPKQSKGQKKRAKKKAKKARLYAEALEYFNTHYIEDKDDKLACWQAISRDLELEVGETVTQCKKILKSVFYNIIDFVYAVKQGQRPYRFGSAGELSDYIKRTDKYYPIAIARENAVLSWMLINVR